MTTTIIAAMGNFGVAVEVFERPEAEEADPRGTCWIPWVVTTG